MPADSLCKQNPGIVPVASQRLLYAELGQRIEIVRQIRFADHPIRLVVRREAVIADCRNVLCANQNAGPLRAVVEQVTPAFFASPLGCREAEAGDAASYLS